MEPNEKRRHRGGQVLNFYAGFFTGRKPSTLKAYVKKEGDAVIQDLIADLLHYAASQPFAATTDDLFEIVESAKAQYQEESRLALTHRSQELMAQ